MLFHTRDDALEAISILQSSMADKTYFEGNFQMLNEHLYVFCYDQCYPANEAKVIDLGIGPIPVHTDEILPRIEIISYMGYQV